MSQAFLPDELETQTLSNLILGESAWTVPWAMFANHDGSLWLNGDYSIDYIPGGTVQMKVTRESEGYCVDISRCDHTWSKKGHGFMGDFLPLKVTKLIQ